MYHITPPVSEGWLCIMLLIAFLAGSFAGAIFALFWSGSHANNEKWDRSQYGEPAQKPLAWPSDHVKGFKGGAAR